MINVGLLKKRVLDLAFKGRLTEQYESETSTELISRLFKNKQKKYIPFSKDLVGSEIPSNWNWCMTYQALSLDNGDETSGEKLPYLEVKFLRTGKNPKIIDSGVVVDKGEKLILVDGENSGEVFLVNERGYKGSTLKILNISDAFIEKYIFLFIYSCKEGFRKNKTGAAIPHLDKKMLFETPLPIPPLEEQKRIVAKLDEIFTELDKIDEKQTRLATIQGKMEAKILKLAIQGKLVEQRPEEGTGEELFNLIQQEKQELIKQGKIKKEKPLSAIEDHEIPFEIPITWKWVRMNDVLDVRDGTHDSPKYHSEGVPFVTSKNLINGDIDFSNTKLISFDDAKKINERSYVENGDILMAMIGTIGNPVIVKKDREFCIKNVALIKNYCKSKIYTQYLFHYLRLSETHLIYIAKASVQQFISLSTIRNYIIPLPPVEEQKRIVAKIEELLPLCNSLK